MVFKISQGTEIVRPAAVAWPYLAALEQVPPWEHGILDVKQIDNGPLFVGLRPARSIIRVIGVAALALAVSACGASSAPASPSARADAIATNAVASSDPTEEALATAATSAALPAPVCFDRHPPTLEPAPANAGNGAPDPDGRIAFGPVSRIDDAMGLLIGPLYLMDADGSDVTQVLGCEIERPRFSPDGTRLVFGIAMDDGSVQVATMDVDGSDLAVLTDTPGYARDPDWSADGSWIVYSLAPVHCEQAPACYDQRLVHPTLWRMDANGSNQAQLGSTVMFDTEPRLSPDGTAVVFDRLDPTTGVQALTIRVLDTGEERRVTTTNVGDITHPDWTRDSAGIIYNTFTDAAGDRLVRIERVPADDPTAAPEVLAGGPGQDAYKPAYAPDGKHIAYNCLASICMMTADGSKQRIVLAVGGLDLNWVAWGRTPRQ